MAAHLVGKSTVMTDHLRALVGNVLGNRCQKVRPRKSLEVAVYPRIQFGAVADVLDPAVERHFGDRKWVSQNILGELFEDVLVFGRNAFSAMHVEAGVFPEMQKTDTVMWEQVEVD